MKLNFIGNGSAFNVNRGNNCAYYIEGDKILFLDFGENIFEKVIKEKKLKNINEVYVAITHMHTDHVGSLPSLMFYYSATKDKIVHVVSGDLEKNKELKLFLNITGANEEYFDFCPSNLNNDFKTIKICEFTKVSHAKSLKQSYAISLTLNSGSKIYYTGDTNDTEYVKNVINSLKDGDEFYCDTCLADSDWNIHTNIDKLNNLVPAEKKKQVYCMHIDNEDLVKKIDEYGFKLAKTDKEKRKEIKNITEKQRNENSQTFQ